MAGKNKRYAVGDILCPGHLSRHRLLNKPNRYGTKVFARGDRHEGMYLKDKREGWGVYCWANKDKYVGEFKTGQVWWYQKVF